MFKNLLLLMFYHTHFVRMKNYFFTKIQISLTLIFIK